jgi:hypothetical protein
LTDCDVSPRLFNRRALRVKHLHSSRILLIIPLEADVVLVRILDHTDEYNHEQKGQVCGNSTGDRDALEALHDADDHEVKVGALSELNQEIQWNERPNRILGSPYAVIAEAILCSIRGLAEVYQTSV